MQFHSKQPLEDNAETDMKMQFNKHKCKRLDASQNAVRIVSEAAEDQ
jgi:hypothetical protein